MASWALRVARRSSLSASSRSSAISRPTTSLNWPTSCHDGWSRQGAPMPGRCEPCPGKIRTSTSHVCYALEQHKSAWAGARRDAGRWRRCERGGELPSPFGVYVHVPFLSPALRLLRLCHLDGPGAPMGAVRRRLRAEAEALTGRQTPRPGDVGFLRRRYAVTPAG